MGKRAGKTNGLCSRHQEVRSRNTSLLWWRTNGQKNNNLKFLIRWSDNRCPTTQTLWSGGSSTSKSFLSDLVQASRWLDSTCQYLSLLRLLRDSSVVWDMYRLTCVGAFWTPPWLTWCGLNMHLKSFWKRSRKWTHTRTQTHTYYLLTHWRIHTYTLSFVSHIPIH